jgi:hypothetical protein
MWKAQDLENRVLQAQRSWTNLGIKYQYFGDLPPSDIWKNGTPDHSKSPIPPFRFSCAFKDLKRLNDGSLKSQFVHYGGSQWRVVVGAGVEDGDVKLTIML